MTIQGIKKPIIIGGKVTTYEQIKYLDRLGFFGFTMGSSLVDKKYIRDGTFVENIRYIADLIQNL